VTSATSLPVSPRIVVWQTTVVRPRCSGTDSPVTRDPSGAPPMKFVFDSIVVVREPCGMLRIAAIAPSVSAKAMIAPPCRLSPIVHRSLRTTSVATTLSGLASVSSSPMRSGRRPLKRSCIEAAVLIARSLRISVVDAVAAVALQRDGDAGPAALLRILDLAKRLHRPRHPVRPPAGLDFPQRLVRLAGRRMRGDDLAWILGVGGLLVEREDKLAPVLGRRLRHALGDLADEGLLRDPCLALPPRGRAQGGEDHGHRIPFSHRHRFTSVDRAPRALRN